MVSTFDNPQVKILNNIRTKIKTESDKVSDSLGGHTWSKMFWVGKMGHVSSDTNLCVQTKNHIFCWKQKRAEMQQLFSSSCKVRLWNWGCFPNTVTFPGCKEYCVFSKRCCLFFKPLICLVHWGIQEAQILSWTGVIKSAYCFRFRNLSRTRRWTLCCQIRGCVSLSSWRHS